MKLLQSPFGIHKRTLLNVLDLEKAFLTLSFSHCAALCSTPSCALFNLPMVRGFQGSVTWSELPTPFVALVVEDQSLELSLHDRVELLATSFAIVEQRLVRAEEITDQHGSPVLLVARKDQRDFTDVVARWFAQKGSALSIYLFESRDGIGRYHSTLSDQFKCQSCGAEKIRPDTMQVSHSEECRQCRGGGWLEDKEQLVACRDCDGVGKKELLANYTFFGKQFSKLLSTKISEVVTELTSLSTGELQPVEKRIQKYLQAAIDFGFGCYSLGQPIEEFDRDEHLSLSLLCASLSSYRGEQLVFSVEEYGLDKNTVEQLSNTVVREKLPVVFTLFAEDPSAISAVEPIQSSTDSISLSNIDEEIFSIERILFPMRVATLVTGFFGTRPSTFLKVVEKRFQKRKKLVGSSYFGGCKTLISIDHNDSSASINTVADLIDLSKDISLEFSRTANARALGLSERDFLIELSAPQSTRVGGIEFNGTSFQDLCSMPLSQLSASFSLNTVIQEKLLLGISMLPLGSTLLSQCNTFSDTLKRYLFCVSRLVIPQPVGQLVLMTTPFGEDLNLNKALVDRISALASSGATLLVAGKGAGVESWFDSVVTLTPYEKNPVQGNDENRYNRRYQRLITGLITAQK